MNRALLLLAACSALAPAEQGPRRSPPQTPPDPKACRHGTYGTSRRTGSRVDTCLCGAQRVNLGEWEGGRRV